MDVAWMRGAAGAVTTAPDEDFRWKDGARAPAGLSAAAVAQRLEEIRERTGALTPEAVVDDARPEGSPLHPAFEWNDRKAAEEYRKEQARHLIRSIVIDARRLDVAAPAPVRAFFVVRPAAEAREEYVPVRVVMLDAALRRQVLERALTELRQFQVKYAALRELTAAIGAVIERFEGEGEDPMSD